MFRALGQASRLVWLGITSQAAAIANATSGGRNRRRTRSNTTAHAISTTAAIST